MNEPSPVSGPACTSTGPGADVTITLFGKGKPPLETVVADLHVRNPLGVPVWLLYNVGDTFPGVVDSVVLSRTPSGPAVHLWDFSGDGNFEAVRIPNGGQITLRDVGLSYEDRDNPPALVFANRITVDGQPAEKWLGRPGLLPTRGDFNLYYQTPRTTERGWRGESLNLPAVQVDVLCVSHVNLPPLVTPTP